jgi:LuxR family maltose regulon positive regulatory protein
VQALGPLEIARDGERLDRNVWAAAKPRELLLFLLAHPKGITREQVGLAFWPDASAEQVRNNFHVTLHRLRKTLGDAKWVVLKGEQYALDPAVHTDFDATRFEREIVGGMSRLKKDGDTAPIESALALYRGDFLANENAGDWHLEMRDRLRLKYVEGLTALAESRVKQERWTDAADAWRRLIATDELDERAYRGLMTAHAKLGERSQVQQIYKRLEQLLQKQLETKPEAETAQLFKKLISVP